MGDTIRGGSADLRDIAATDTTTIDAVIDKMETSEPLLSSSNLGHVAAFHIGYKEVTKDVRDRSLGLHGEEKTFKQQKVIEQATIKFAGFYFDAMHSWLTPGAKKISVWEPLFSDPRARKASPAIQFGLGMNTHIRRDLADMLSNLLKNKEEAEAYLDDFFGVDDLLDGTAHALSPEYVPLPGGLRKLVVNGTMRYIKKWRSEAWDNYIVLRECNGNQQQRQQVLSGLDKEVLITSERLLTHGQSAFSILEIPNQVGKRLTKVAFDNSQ